MHVGFVDLVQPNVPMPGGLNREDPMSDACVNVKSFPYDSSLSFWHSSN